MWWLDQKACRRPWCNYVHHKQIWSPRICNSCNIMQGQCLYTGLWSLIEVPCHAFSLSSGLRHCHFWEGHMCTVYSCWIHDMRPIHINTVLGFETLLSHARQIRQISNLVIQLKWMLVVHQKNHKNHTIHSMLQLQIHISRDIRNILTHGERYQVHLTSQCLGQLMVTDWSCRCLIRAVVLN